MASYYGKLDFTKLCRLWKDHKELFDMVDFKDGKHALLKVNFNERQQADEHGNTHYLQANCKKDQRKEGLDYFVGSSFRPSQNDSQQSNTTSKESGASVEENDGLPF